MINAVKLFFPRSKADDLTNGLDEYRCRDSNFGGGRIGNVSVAWNLDYVSVRVSLPKFLNRENMTTLTRGQVELAVRRLECDLGLSLSGAVVVVEIGSSFIVKEKPSEYLWLLGACPGFKQYKVFSKDSRLETVAYSTSHGSYQFCGYDKTREMVDKKKKVPAMFDGCNVLRLEYRIVKRRGLRAKFGKDLLAYDLFNYEVYAKLKELFSKAYKKIEKLGRKLYIDTSKPMTPSKLKELLAEQYRQACNESYMMLLQKIKESGAINERGIERIRHDDRVKSRDFTVSDKSTLFEELDAAIENRVRYG
jgi:hypothetical protein